MILSLIYRFCILLTLMVFGSSFHALFIKSQRLKYLYSQTELSCSNADIPNQDHLSKVKSLLTGTFSNMEQADEDHSQGKFTGAEGGHEFVTASISHHPTLQNVLVATYFYGEDRESVFRYRLYELTAAAATETIAGCKMKLYRPTLLHDAELKVVKYMSEEPPALESFEYLGGCDVVWAERHDDNEVMYDGTLEEGECVICSQQDPSCIVKVKDNLRLSERELWINDRVYATNGRMIIGNTEGVPYKLRRILL